MKYLFDQLRLYLAEKLMGWAFDLMPEESSEKIAFARAFQIYCMDVARSEGMQL